MARSARVRPRRPWPAQHAGRGFSLIELLVVIAILGILSVSAGPMLGSVSRNRQALAATALAQHVAYARQLAVSMGTRSWVVFDAGAETWSLYGEDPDNPGRANRSLLTDPATSTTFVVTLGSGSYVGSTIESVTIPGSGAEIGFDYLGRPLLEDETAMESDATITLAGSHAIVVCGRTGHVIRQ